MFTHIDHPEIKRPFVEQLNIKGGHYYKTINGDIYPSITTVQHAIPNPGIEAWISRVGEKEAKRVSESSMNVGTKMHEIFENYLNNYDTINLDSRDVFEKDPLELLEAAKPELQKIDNIHGLEKKLYSDELKIAGTVDCVAEYDGVLSIIDFKNSRRSKTPSMVKGYFEQGCAYSKMWKECVKMDIQQIVILVISWDNKARAFKAKVSDWESQLWNTLIKFESIS